MAKGVSSSQNEKLKRYMGIRFLIENEEARINCSNFLSCLYLAEINHRPEDLRTTVTLLGNTVRACQTIEELQAFEKVILEASQIGSLGSQLKQGGQLLIQRRMAALEKEKKLPDRVSSLLPGKQGIQSAYLDIEIQSPNPNLALQLRSLLTALAAADICKNKQTETLVLKRLLSVASCCHTEEELETFKKAMEEAASKGGFATLFYPALKPNLTLKGLAAMNERYERMKSQQPTQKVSTPAPKKPLATDYLDPIGEEKKQEAEEKIEEVEELKPEEKTLSSTETYLVEEFQHDYHLGITRYHEVFDSRRKPVTVLEDLFYQLRQLKVRLQEVTALLPEEEVRRTYGELEDAIATTQKFYLHGSDEKNQFVTKYKRCIYEFSEVAEARNKRMEDLEEIYAKFRRLLALLEDTAMWLEKKEIHRYEDEIEENLRKIKKIMTLLEEQAQAAKRATYY